LPFDLLHTFALHINPATLVAKLEFTLAGHMITALVLLHPELAFGTLLELLPLHKRHEFLVVLTGRCRNIILLARHFLMPLHSAIQAIFLLTLQTLKAFTVLLLKKEHVATGRSGAPRTE
jgi:hypothetical protein